MLLTQIAVKWHRRRFTSLSQCLHGNPDSEVFPDLLDLVEKMSKKRGKKKIFRSWHEPLKKYNKAMKDIIC